MDEAYRKLADEVFSAGGSLDLPPGDLSLRLGTAVDDYDEYEIVRSRLLAVGLFAAFHEDGGARLEFANADAGGLYRAFPDAVMMDAGRSIGSAPERAASQQPFSEQVGNGLYALLWFVCTFFPAIGHQIAPGGEVGEKQDAFFAIYIATFPLSLAATFIFLMLFQGWFETDQQRLVAAGVAIVASAVWGIGFGTSYADMHAISQLHGPPPLVLLGLVFLAVGAYAIFYGPALFFAGVLSSFFAALWITEKTAGVAEPKP